ncbi:MULTISPECIES: helix-turn-helix domain-containing protein [Tenacibaculum]|uniref:helix-turn-helix domain-containing protein n=1 Tax=Tenacibaculum TaxID=104267 RepID=UPI001F0AE241|nr:MULTISPECIES: helix-turn-helix transcriptional regulator [Tenacibaculum]MCH3881571.1 helix-turn-helix transcriptional regulator [Tenacibaculum aquimarinum]MDO6598834.1 helix-turn-helix transcriptional regulator [Tenacibaculum sp. 1_MG-2023]
MEYINPAEVLKTKLLQRIRKEREEKGLTQYDLARKIGLSQTAYHKIERGGTRLDMFRFFKIAIILEISPSKLMDN